MTRIYGGESSEAGPFASKTIIEVGLFRKGDTATVDGHFIAYLGQGKGIANGTQVSAGDLFRDDGLEFETLEDTQLVVVFT